MDSEIVHNLIQDQLNNSKQRPQLSMIYALEIDRLLREAGLQAITVSANNILDHGKDCDLKNVVDISSANNPARNLDTAVQSEILTRGKNHNTAIAFAFNNVQHLDINCLNIIYANHSTRLRKYFLNKYLSSYKLKIELVNDPNLGFFESIITKSNGTNLINNEDLVSIIITAFNAESTISLSLGSILSQSWSNIEVIVVDDASTDKTNMIVKGMKKLDSRIKLITNPVNIGTYASRNLGYLLSTGKYLTTHDSDDLAFPDRIEKQVATIKGYDCEACTGSMLRMDINGKITRPTEIGRISSDGYQRLCFSSLMILTDVFKKELGAWDSVRVGADTELVLRLSKTSVKSKHLWSPLMLCLDAKHNLTNDPILGLVDSKGSETKERKKYRSHYINLHESQVSKKISIYPFYNTLTTENTNTVQSSRIKDCINSLRKQHFRNAECKTNLNFLCDSKCLTKYVQMHKDHGYKEAINFAKNSLPDYQKHVLSILTANEEACNGSLNEWLTHVNTYLEHFNCQPISICPDADSVLNSICTRERSEPIKSGPLVSIIMTTWNSEDSIRTSLNSILDQSWRNLEILIVDDASTDRTWSILCELANTDRRIKIYRNKVNVGPYVSKNSALKNATGFYVTCHDSDDWAFPKRIEEHVNFAQKIGDEYTFSSALGLRINDKRQFTNFGNINNFSYDGIARMCLVSTLFNLDWMRKNLGYWDNVRFGADSEIYNRACALTSRRESIFYALSMLCLDSENSLTNDPINGIKADGGKLSQNRKQYKTSWVRWHDKIRIGEAVNSRLPFIQSLRSFEAPLPMIVPNADIETNLQ